MCYPWLRPYTKHKLEQRSKSCLFLGYSNVHNSYICFEPQDHKFYFSRHVQFVESVFPSFSMSNECDKISSYTLQKWSAASPSLKSLQQDLPFSDQSSSNIPPLSPKNLSPLTTLLPVTSPSNLIPPPPSQISTNPEPKSTSHKSTYSPSKCDTPIDKRTQGSPTKSLPSSTSSHFSTNNGNSSNHALSHGPSQPTSKSSPSRSVIPLMTNSHADYDSMQDCDLQHVVDPPISDTNHPTFSGSSSSEIHPINELVHVPVPAPPTTIQT